MEILTIHSAFNLGLGCSASNEIVVLFLSHKRAFKASVVFSPSLDQQLKVALLWKLPLLFQVQYKADKNTVHLLTPALQLLTAVAAGRKSGLNLATPAPLQLSTFLAHSFLWVPCYNCYKCDIGGIDWGI